MVKFPVGALTDEIRDALGEYALDLIARRLGAADFDLIDEVTQAITAWTDRLNMAGGKREDGTNRLWKMEEEQWKLLHYLEAKKKKAKDEQKAIANSNFDDHF